MKQKQDDSQKEKPFKPKGSKALKARVHKHLNDKNDVITDDDIKNIKVGAEETTEEDLKGAEELAESMKKRNTSTPWSILSEEDK